MTTTLNLGRGPVSFFNGTPHSINLMRDAEYVPSMRKHIGGVEVAEIPPSGVLLSARLATIPQIDLGCGVIIAKQEAVACDPLPQDALEADYIVVSPMYATAYRQIHGADGVKLLVPRDLVVESQDNPRPVGCLGFSIL